MEDSNPKPPPALEPKPAPTPLEVKHQREPMPTNNEDYTEGKGDHHADDEF
jgi:hypothetical protein